MSFNIQYCKKDTDGKEKTVFLFWDEMPLHRHLRGAEGENEKIQMINSFSWIFTAHILAGLCKCKPVPLPPAKKLSGFIFNT